ncbi:MAG: polysaccharide biosynthesis C-terminal domain-containing protein [Candidatus Krumholzibacteria bacterium]|nr:polysaccharide biosynthesis C-terminal domain-containing protein [Candidatus Krumholzibacteria bacterium]
MNATSENTLRDLAVTFGAKMCAIFLTYGVQVVLARTLEPTGRGSYDASLILATALLVALNPGAEMATLFFITSRRLPYSQGVTAGLTLTLLAGIVAMFAGLVLMLAPLPIMAGILTKASSLEFMLGLATIPSTLMLQTCLSIANARKDYIYLAGLQIGRRVVALLLVITFVAWLRYGVAGALTSVIAGEWLLVYACLAHFRSRHGWQRGLPSRSDLLALLRYGARYYLGKLGNFVNFKLGALVLAFLATTEELGYYGQALAIAIQFLAVSDSVFLILLPRVAECADGGAELIARALRLTFLLGLVVMAPIFVFAEPLFLLSFSAAFLPSVAPFQILVLGFFLRSLGKTVEPFLIGTNRPGSVSLSIAVGLVANLALLFYLYPRWGIVGAAWALVANYAASTLLLLLFYTRKSGIALARIWLVTGDDLTAVQAAVRRLGNR